MIRAETKAIEIFKPVPLGPMGDVRATRGWKRHMPDIIEY